MERILYAGDSTVAFNKINTYPQTGMSQALPLYLKDNIQVISFAKNGRSTRSFIAEGTACPPLRRNLRRGDICSSSSVTMIQKQMKRVTPIRIRILRKISGCLQRQQRPAVQRPYLLPPLPDVCLMKTELLNRGSHGAYPRAMKEAAKEAGVPVVDLTTVTEQYLAQVGELWSRPLFVWPKDNTHLKI